MEAILLAAGVGSRMKLTSPKQFVTILGKPRFTYSLEALKRSLNIEKIYLTCNASYLEDYKIIIDKYHIDNVECILGGTTRQESVFIALQYVKTGKVLIHEAARPLVSVDFIDEVIDDFKEDAVVPTIPINFSIVEGDNVVCRELNRSRLHNVQLPQVFNTDKLLAAHKLAIRDNYMTTEDGMLLFHYGGSVNLIRGRESNIKVTTNLDLAIVEKLLKLQ